MTHCLGWTEEAHQSGDLIQCYSSLMEGLVFWVMAVCGFGFSSPGDFGIICKIIQTTGSADNYTRK